MKLTYFSIPGKVLKAMYYGVRLFLRPHELNTLIQLANQLTDLKAFDEAVLHVKEDAQAKALIAERYSPKPLNMEKLKTCAPGSFGLAYYNHMQAFGLTPYFAPDVSLASEKIYLRERQRVVHDYVHALLNIGTTVEEEAKLNAIFMVKGCSPFTSVIVAGAFFHFLFKRPSELVKLTREVNQGFNYGEQLRTPFAFRWEEHIHSPLSEVRALMSARSNVAELPQLEPHA